MDPHSTRSQFNQRTPKAGPYMPQIRYTDPSPKFSIESYAKSKSPRPDCRAADAISLLIQRPIATNSRVKQDEQFKKDMYIAFINKALQGKLDGQSKDFDDLVDQFNPRKARESATSSSQLRLWILALGRHSPLVEAIVNLPWTTMDATFVKTYTEFIGMLLSARPEYLSLMLGRLTQGLTYQSGLQALNANGPEGSESPLTRRVIYDRLHYLLGHLLSLIPTLPSTLQPLLRQPQAAQVTYIRNLLRVTEYCSALSDRILALIIDRALQIDVEIQVELEELEEEEGGLGNADVFEFDPFDVVTPDEDGDEDEDSASDFSSHDSDDSGDNNPDLPANAQHIQDMVDKLDSILKVVFDHFNRLHSTAEVTVSPRSDTSLSPPTSPRPSSPISAEAGRAVRDAQFHALLAIFDRTIIRTFKSRYTQFLIFCDLFQGLLVEKALLGQDVPAVTRCSCSNRAQFVDRDATRCVVGVLCTFLKSHLDAFDSVIQAGEELPSMAHHSLFYAIAQAVFLIFCFRWRDLEEEFDESEEYQSGKKWMSDLNVIQRVITSPLNPLKFARVAKATDFAYCYSILEANKRSEYNLNAGSIPDSAQELHTFFPFDPYKLPRSSSYIQGVYRDWASVAIDEEDEEEEDAEEDDGLGDDYVLSSTIPDVGLTSTGGLGIPSHSRSSSDAGGLGESFGGMSISPQPQSVVMVS
ncbi:RNA polymerase I-specific transcription initiation factor RRN3 [Pisolithus tinctorius]|nr:RNA polymerase I-specific transcription initiation factor RRN3 [Pisolithus tinctorius]